MKIEFGDIQLQSLEPEHLEMVRKWRNSAHIVSNMDHKTHITAQAQIDWYDSIDMQANTYFIIVYEHQSYGLIHLANIDFDKHIADSGLFIGIPSALGSPIPMIASLALLEFAFRTLRLTSIFAKVAKHNQKAIDYNMWLGFRFQETISIEFDRYILLKSLYNEQCHRCLSLFKLQEQTIEVSIRASNTIDEQLARKFVTSEAWTLIKS